MIELDTAHLSEAVALLHAGQHALAKAKFNEVLACNPQDETALVLRGQCLMVLQDYELALADFAAADALSEPGVKYAIDRGLALCALQNWPEAVEALTRGIWFWKYMSGDPNRDVLAQAHYYLAFCWLKLGDKEAMRAEQDNAAEYDPDGLLDPWS